MGLRYSHGLEGTGDEGLGLAIGEARAGGHGLEGTRDKALGLAIAAGGWECGARVGRLRRVRGMGVTRG